MHKKLDNIVNASQDSQQPATSSNKCTNTNTRTNIGAINVEFEKAITIDKITKRVHNIMNKLHSNAILVDILKQDYFEEYKCNLDPSELNVNTMKYVNKYICSFYILSFLITLYV